MKKLSLLIFVLIFCQVKALSQDCLPCLSTGITFNTQNQLDSFQINHPDCTEILGNVIIEGDDITNLNGLAVLTSVGGNIQIINNPALTSLTGLGNVTAIGGSLIFDFNYALTSLTGLGNIISIGGNLGIGNSASLVSLTGLENVTTIGGELNIDDNAALASLTGLENVTSIGGILYIDFNSSLTNFTGLDNLASIGGGLVVFENISLISLSGIDNIDAGTISYLSIEENPLLSSCEVQSICDYLVSPGGTISIHDNATGCNSQQEVEDACDVVPVENISFEEGLSIYPNPANTELFISIRNGAIITEATIYNQIGQKVLHKQPVAQPIDVSMLRQGMYIIEVCSHGFKTRVKLIIR